MHFMALSYFIRLFFSKMPWMEDGHPRTPDKILKRRGGEWRSSSNHPSILPPWMTGMKFSDILILYTPRLEFASSKAYLVTTRGHPCRHPSDLDDTSIRPSSSKILCSKKVRTEVNNLRSFFSYVHVYVSIKKSW